MVKYFPILKAKQGELAALQNFEHELDGTVTPIVEVVPWERENGSSEDSAELDKAAKRIGKAWGSKRGTFFVDAAAAELDPESGWTNEHVPVLGHIITSLRGEGTPAAPVIRGSALAADGYLGRLQESFQETNLTEAIIRITTEDLDEAVIPLREVATQVSSALSLRPSQVDLVLDFGAVGDDSAASMAARLARFVLPQFDQGGWRSVVLASGAFPLNLSDVVPYTVSNVPRNDLKLWRSIREIGFATELSFGDYAVTHPSWPQGVGFAAPPQLRYAAGDNWLVAKGRRQDRRGHGQFFEICEAVLTKAGIQALAPEASWGDDRIHQAAAKSRDDGIPLGPGNASTWRAIATSHHIAEVVHQLRELGDS